jgi:hypothetical protein
LLPRPNPKYDPNHIQGGFQMVGGGLIVGGGADHAAITASGSSITLRYHIPRNAAPGDLLDVSLMSNCAVSLAAGPGETPVFGPPVIVRPDMENRRVRVPLGVTVPSGVVTVIFDLIQPGRILLSKPALGRNSETAARSGAAVDGWRAGRDTVDLRMQDGVLFVHSSAPDPWIELEMEEPVRSGAPFTLRFDILAESSGDLRLYDRNTAGRGFSPPARVDVTVPAEGRWVEVSGRLKSGAPLHAIRIGMPNHSGESRLRNIRLENAEGAVVRPMVRRRDPMKKRSAILSRVVWQAGLLAAGLAYAAAPERPNIILIYSDDHGYADLGIQGACNEVRTPNIDRLARDGVRFPRGYATAPQCVPSRAGLMTGRHQNRFNMETNHDGPLPLSERTLADRLQAAGYATGMIGKWHLEPVPNSKHPEWDGRSSAPYLPRNRGFEDYWNGPLTDTRPTTGWTEARFPMRRR